MLVLGLSGGLDTVQQNRKHLFVPGTFHDAAAALVEDGKVVAAIEEERFNRIKHTQKGAVNAIRFCLNVRGVDLTGIDHLVYYGSDEGLTLWTHHLFYGSRDAQPVLSHRQLIHDLLRDGLGEDVDDSKLGFVNHHLAHATSTYAQSGFSDSLVLTVDGGGDGLSGSVTLWQGSQYQLLRTYDLSQSLGTFYDRVIQILGFGFTEEFKVMGLAPYGNPGRFRHAFSALCTLLPNGDYALNWNQFENALYGLVPVRKKGEPILQDHKDLAAALQEALERIVFHIASYFRRATGSPRLCLAGGVAHNSTMNGRLLYSGLFQDIFVHPASHDAGCAVGAALFPFMNQTKGVAEATAHSAIRHVFWGTDIGDADEIGKNLAPWKPLIRFQRESKIAERTAALLAEGRVIGWVQGRSEFGPRALGNRSILADPRPASHKDLINAMVKKREAYRPFAPAVQEEFAAQYFEVPQQGATFPFMSFTLTVRPEWRDILGATTHVDFTSRVQTVSQQANPEFWALLEAFRQMTGVAVLLNTSFNNNAEPIVDSVNDAVACFLTTGLEYLVVGEYLVSKDHSIRQGILGLCASLPPYARLTETIAPGRDGGYATTYAISNTYNDDSIPISQPAFDLLSAGTGQVIHTLVDVTPDGASTVAEELYSLWERRVIALHTSSPGAGPDDIKKQTE